MKLIITPPRGYYRRKTGRRQPNRRRLQKIMKRLGIYNREKLNLIKWLNTKTNITNIKELPFGVLKIRTTYRARNITLF